jgi:hypothetical protein
MTAEAKALQLIENELRFIARHSQQIEGSFEVVDDINHAVNSALRALHELQLERQEATEEMPAGVIYSAAA